MKLFVLGESSLNPDDWSIWSELQIVIAPNAEAALAMGEKSHGGLVSEIPMDREMVLVSMPEPNFGEDL